MPRSGDATRNVRRFASAQRELHLPSQTGNVQTSPDANLNLQTGPAMPYAPRALRLLAYFLDVIPLVLLVAAVFYFFLGFDEVLRDYLKNQHAPAVRLEFLTQRNRIRNYALVVYILYSWLMDASPLQGTIGKLVLRMKVVDGAGDRLTLARSCARNFAKVAAASPCAMGFLPILFRRDRRGLHDLAAGTYVVSTPRLICRAESPEDRA
jgi:uncharacterized RDD family membrane protein YckC